MRFYTLAAFFLTLNTLIAQSDSDLKIGQWRAYLPYQVGQYVTQSDHKIYYATPLSVVSIDKDDYSQQFFSKVEGLSDVGMGIIGYNPVNQTLLLTYSNGNIDLVRPDGSIANLSDIKSNTNIVGDRTIYSLFFKDDNAYLSCGFGIVKLNMSNGEFEFTTFTDVKVKAMNFFNGLLYAATEDGIYTAPENSSLNLSDFNNWHRLDAAASFPDVYHSNALGVYQNHLYCDVNDTLFRIDNDVPVFFHHEEGFAIRYLTAQGEHLLAGLNCGTGCSDKVLIFDENGNATPSGPGCVDRNYMAIEDSQGRVWYADGYNGFRFTYSGQTQCNNWSFNSPATPNSSNLAVYNHKLYVATGGVDNSESPLGRGDGFFSLVDGQWKVYGLYTSQVMADSGAWRDLYRVAVNPANGKVYVGSFYDGLVEINNDQIKVYNDFNSSLGGVNGDSVRQRISGLTFDAGGNLWISNYLAKRPVSVFTKEGTWKSFPALTTQLFQIAVDELGYKWIVIGGTSQGLLVFDTGEDILSESDDRYKRVDNSNSAIKSSKVSCVAVDLDGDVWVGTGEGVVRFTCGSSIFEGCPGDRPISQKDNINAYLLDGEDVHCITVDGANRKWCGTSNGVFVISADGSREIANYNVDNSPLLDNLITDIAIDGQSGEAFIGTNRGIVSVRGEAIAGGEVNNASAYAFPNPVRPGYEGPIAVTGLARDANVKITDVNGLLVYETKALGGQAIWDGRDVNGRRVNSGVYLVFSTGTQHPENPDAIVTKILVIR